MVTLQSHVINLPKDGERLERALSRAYRVGLQPHVFAARTPADLSPHEQVSPTLTPGEIGVFLSHRSLLKEVGDAAADSLHLVLEDDVIFFEGFRDRFEEVVAELSRTGPRLVQVGWLPTAAESTRAGLWWRRVKSTPAVRAAVHRLKSSTPLVPPILDPVIPGWGMHCYLISPVIAREFSTILGTAMLAPVDYYLRAFSQVEPDRVYRTRFPLAGQDWTFSSTVREDRFVAEPLQIDGRGRVIRYPATSHGGMFDRAEGHG